IRKEENGVHGVNGVRAPVPVWEGFVTGKKTKGKKKKVVEDDPNALTEVDKTFYELTIADLNRKLARLRSLTQELEEKNEELEQQGQKNDEDKSDIITYLKRMIQEKTNEINELEERIVGLQETRQTETEQFETKIVELEQEYKQMHEQLTSENKLLDGKLNSLEEFRSQRDELMKKFEDQEKKMEVQEKRHNREMYEIERKFIISKDKLKKDMEARLMQLSTEFHDASELRIAATTHRVIRENIAVNNEFDNMLQMHQKLFRDYSNLKNKSETLRQEAVLHDVEKKKALSKVLVQKTLIEKITEKNGYLRQDLARYKRYETEIREARKITNTEQQNITNLQHKVRILEQNVHKMKCDNCALETDVLYLKAENERLDDILMEGVSCIKEALTIKSESDSSIKSSKRENLLITLFSLLSKGHERRVKKPSLETVTSAEGTYALGDLGFVPKPTDPRPIAKTRRDITSQTGESFEEFLNFGDVSQYYVKKTYADCDDKEISDEKKESVLFFDENEAPEEDEEEESGEYDPFAEADDDCVIKFRVEQFNLPCGNQWLKIRDGSSLSSALLSDLSGQPGTVPSQVNSTGPNLLLEFYSDDITLGSQVCDGGFLAEASQIRLIKLNISAVQVAHSVSSVIPLAVLKLTSVHIAAIFFLSGLIIATTILGIQYVFRYRKYQVAQLEDQDSLSDRSSIVFVASSTNLQMSARTQSNATLLSEVISLTRMRPLNMKSRQNKHTRLRESVDCDRDIDEEVALAKDDRSATGSSKTLIAENEVPASTALPTLANPECDDLTPTSSVPTSPRGQWKIIRRSSTLSEKDGSTEKDVYKNQSRRVSNVTLTNVSDDEMCSKSDPGCYSSVASMVSVATIRSTNAKATKDKRNREKLLAGPGGSEFSISAPDNDLEIDYYDYNVVNAGAAPGSYLGMDPAFLVWIPPLDESGEILPHIEVECHEMVDIRPKVYVNPGSNTESPEEESLVPKPRRRSVSESIATSSLMSKKKVKKVIPLVHGNVTQVDNKYLNEARHIIDNRKVAIQMQEFPRKLRPIVPLDMEKETKVEKSPSVNNSILDDIQFADDDEEELDLSELPHVIESKT
ncbi:hypothetical protein D910_12596, partial [Dendroctonus ponderosae]